ncbi:MAG: hypothetical protein J1D88_03260 [Treponema sp.]|nr:hypothetical protein [Treponema sp.]
MKAYKKIVSIALAALFVYGQAVAQDSAEDFENDSFASGFDDDFGSGFGGEDDFGASYDSGSSDPVFEFSGAAQMEARLFPGRNDSEFDTAGFGSNFANRAIGINPQVTLGINYSGSVSEFSGKFKFNRQLFTDYPEDILQEFTARLYLGDFILEAGKMKLVWGKGDKVHVLDNFNANDYTDFIVPDYIDRRIAEPMFHIIYNAPVGMRLEGVWTPIMTADRLASSGMWQPALTAKLTGQVEKLMHDDLEAVLLGGENPIDALKYATNFSADSLYKDNLKSLKFGQAGLRSTFTLGPVDLGVSYYYGHYKQPSANLQNTIIYKAVNYNEKEEYISGHEDSVAYKMLVKQGMESEKASGMVEYIKSLDSYKIKNSLPELYYDQLSVFGLEAATVIGPFNTRAEFAYNLTNDIAGDDPWVKNNSIAWEFGFDIDLPIHNINLNAQTTGKYILHKNEIKNGGIEIAGLPKLSWSMLKNNYDVDYDTTGTYSRNQLIVDITDTFNYEKIKLDIKGIYQFETKDLILLPSLSFKLGSDDFTLNLSGLIICAFADEDSEYYAWRNNDFFAIGCKYQF